MSGLALIVALTALALATAAFVQSTRLRRRFGEIKDGRREADELLYAAWLEEIETRGEHILARMEEAAGATSVPPLEKTSVAVKDAPEPTIRTDSKQQDVKNYIRALARAGDSPAEIARRLHLSAGEVEVILDLDGKDAP